jgi:transcription elongation GreA/GreB family factor
VRGAPYQIEAMSRAFVKETDDVEDLPERPISPAPNLVTAEGLALIEAEIAALQDALAQAGEDRAARAAIGRDLRYWTARRGSAQVQPPPQDCDEVRFGCTVKIARDDGREQSFRIVGEDEADPERGTLSYVSPLARALMGKSESDVIALGDAEIEILSIG